MRTFSALILACLFVAIAWPAHGQGEALGAIKATTKVWMDGSRSVTVVDPEQRTATETREDSQGHPLKKTVYLLDERNLAMGAIHYDLKGNIRYKESYRRDAADHIIETTFTSTDGRPLGKRIFYYSGDKVSSVEDYDASGNRLAVAQAATAADSQGNEGPKFRKRH